MEKGRDVGITNITDYYSWLCSRCGLNPLWKLLASCARHSNGS